MIRQKLLFIAVYFVSSVFCPLSYVFAGDVPYTISYQGFVKQNGIVYNGTGYFKFKIINSDGSYTYWSNDGTHDGADTTPPDSSVSTSVANGVFNIVSGDSTIGNIYT